MELHLNSSHFYALGIGFALGLVLLFFSVRGHWRTSREFRRYKKMLSDKMELDQRQSGDLIKERDRLTKENENLRLQVARLNDRSDNRLDRELEICARAERQMNINAPGFAPAWEIAKSQALAQLVEEEKGSSLPQRIFRKLTGGGSASPAASLPASKSENAPAESANA